MSTKVNLIDCLIQTLICFHKFGITVANENPDFVKKWTLINYVYIRLKELLKIKLKYVLIPDNFLRNIIKKISNKIDYYIDYNSCALVSSELITCPDWYYICSLVSGKRYKLFLIPANEIPKDVVYMSESMAFNVNQHLSVQERNYMFYFLMPEKKETQCAKKANVSFIHSTQNYTNDLINILLENYFSIPRFLRKNDIFGVELKKFAPEYFYTNQYLNYTTLYFIVTNLDGEYNTGKYIFKNDTQLILDPHIKSFKPPKLTNEINSRDLFNYETMISLNKNYPQCMHTYLVAMEDCIRPFLKKEFHLNIQPVFLIRGSQGSGKFKLVETFAKQKGFHFVYFNCSECRTLATGQKETKIRVILQNALSCTPCILLVQNIELIGINAEGKKDERALATFSVELKNTFNQDLKFPLLVFATTEIKNIPVELEGNIIEIIEIKNMSNEERLETIHWLLKTNGINYDADVKSISNKCSDYCFADLETLVSQGLKNCYQNLTQEALDNEKNCFTLSDDSLNKAHDWLQQILSDEIGTPNIPKVYWEDIGGLAELKKDIMGRIELSMLLSSEGEKSGLLLYGQPGTGKTLIAKAIATEYQFHFLSVKGPELLNMYVGQSEENIRQLFEKARAAAPCILFFDELDSLAPSRGRSGDSGGVMDRVVSQLMTEMDGIEMNSHIFIIGATNRPDLIDSALLRPGRFDKMLYVGMYSDKKSQRSVLKALTRKFNLEKNGKELDEIVDVLPTNLTGADLYSICSEAWTTAVKKFIQANENDLQNQEFEKDPVIVTIDDFREALIGFKPSVSKSELKKYESLKNK